MNHKLDALLEGQQSMASVPGDIAELKTDVQDVRARLTNVEFAITDLSQQDRQLDKRVGKLEKTAA
jgi:cell division protein FtsL